MEIFNLTDKGQAKRIYSFQEILGGNYNLFFMQEKNDTAYYLDLFFVMLAL